MKYLIIVLSVILLSLKSNSTKDIIELPINFVEGYGNFYPGFSLIGEVPPDNPWFKTEEHALTGVPKDWEKVVKSTIWFDAQQFAYQNYKQGMLSEEFFNDLKVSWKINLDKRPLSEKPIKSFVYIIYSKDKNENIKYKIDSDNDFDFADEHEYSSVKFEFSKTDSLVKCCSHKVKYESYRNGRIVELIAPILIVEINGSLWKNFPQHGEAELSGRKIIISSESFGSISYAQVVLLEASAPKSIDGVKENEFILIGEDIYKNLGVNLDKQVLLLKKMPKDTVIYSSQVGFNAKNFTEKEFTTNEELSLDTYKGKFLFMEFWGSWCKPCLKELPHVKKAYQSIDKSKIDFLGIALDEAEPLKKLLEKEKIEWKQIMREREEGIIADYNISSYPTSFLIDPNGKILAKNLRGEKLLDTLNYYINKK